LGVTKVPRLPGTSSGKGNEDNLEHYAYKMVAENKVYKRILVELEPETPEQKQMVLRIMRESTWLINYVLNYLYKEGLIYEVAKEVADKGFPKSLYGRLFHMLKETYGVPDWLIKGVLKGVSTILSQWYNSGTFGKGHYPQVKAPRLSVLSTWFFPDLDNLDKPRKIKESKQGYLWLPIGVKLREIGMNISYMKKKGNKQFDWSDAKWASWSMLIYREEYDKFFLEIVLMKDATPPRKEIKGFYAVDVNSEEIVSGTGDKYLEKRYPTVISDPKASAKIDFYTEELERLRNEYPKQGNYDPLERRKGLRHRVWLIKRARNEIAKHHIVKIAKEIVDMALTLGDAIVLEDLKGLQRKLIEESDMPKEVKAKIKIMDYYKLNKWLNSLAKQYGIPVIHVNPSGTSTTCPRCGSKMVQVEDPVIGKRTMVCTNPKCGFKEDRDTVAIMNLAKRGKEKWQKEKEQALRSREQKVSIGQKSSKSKKNTKWSRGKKAFKP